MKKLFTMLSVVAISTTLSFAQQGSVAIGVGSNLADVSWQNYSLTPTVGYFIADNMMVGMGFKLGSTSSTRPGFNDDGDEVSFDVKTSGMEMSPFFRYFMNDAFFGQVGIMMGSGSSTDSEEGTADSKVSSFGLQAAVGYSLMWNDKVCIEPYFGIETGSGSSEVSVGNVTVSTDAPSTFDMGIGLSIHIRLGGE